MQRLFWSGPLILILMLLAGSIDRGSRPAQPVPPPTATPTLTMVWPTLTSLEPVRAWAGAPVRVIGHGGYLVGPGTIDESARWFDLTFDGQVSGSLLCYIGHCEVTLIVPVSAAVGTHQVAVEGGSHLPLEVHGAAHHMYLPLFHQAVVR